MLRTAGAVLIATALLAPLAGPSAAAPVTDWKQVQKTLDGIQTAAGISLKKRMDACKMVIHPETSWTETRAVAWPDYGAKPGDTVLKLVFDVPPAPSQPGPAAKLNPPQKNIAAFWVISHGKAEPLSAWAKALQMRPVPLGYDASNNC
jgi:hypothetical protein